MAYKISTENSIKDNNLKLTADKIIQNLDQLREEGKKSRRRWIWELMQNAKDVKNKYGKVTINIELNDQEFAFTHNGDPFSINNITCLIQQVSSKPSDSSQTEITGKFGTGFIATHLLSDVITVKGVVKEEGETPKRFNLKLDRSGETSEELMPVIGESLNEISQIDNDDLFPIDPNYEEKREEDDLDNVFSYPIFEANKTTAIDAIEDLLKTLPLTMAFNDKIKKVSINNAIKNTHYTYLCETKKKDNGISHAHISIIDEHNKIEKEHFYIIKSQDEPNFDLAIKVDGFAKPTLIANEDSSPFLYRDFPLIGSNKFYFPFILNGKSLNPTDRRDGIFLIGNTKKTTHNRAILQAAIKESANFVDYLISLEACNLFVTALSSLPDYNFDEDEDFECKDWYIENIQKYYRKELISKHIHSKAKTLSEIKFPYDEMAKGKLDALRDVCAPIFGKGCIPEKSEYEIWLNFIGPYEEKDTWGVQLYVDIEDILELLQENKKLDQITLFPTEIGELPVERLTWLNSFYQFLIDVYGKIPDNYEIVPNENNIFKKFSTLFI
ncbi:hypothetical protein HXX01_05510, partial [Candidatus Nomurabacteria bacterium]|nr:hypothetical protein [Candidatus Nomurabacteria bacterium]